MRLKLIVALVSDDKTDLVVDAGREAGATGATVITSGRGEGLRPEKTFFGLALEAKRDVILFLVAQPLARHILEAYPRRRPLRFRAWSWHRLSDRHRRRGGHDYPAARHLRGIDPGNMSSSREIRVGDVMSTDVHSIDGLATVADAMAMMRQLGVSSLVVNRRDDNDEIGLILVSDIARHVVAPDRSPDRVNVSTRSCPSLSGRSLPTCWPATPCAC